MNVTGSKHWAGARTGRRLAPCCSSQPQLPACMSGPEVAHLPHVIAGPAALTCRRCAAGPLGFPAATRPPATPPAQRGRNKRAARMHDAAWSEAHRLIHRSTSYGQVQGSSIPDKFCKCGIPGSRDGPHGGTPVPEGVRLTEHSVPLFSTPCWRKWSLCGAPNSVWASKQLVREPASSRPAPPPARESILPCQRAGTGWEGARSGLEQPACVGASCLCVRGRGQAPHRRRSPWAGGLPAVVRDARRRLQAPIDVAGRAARQQAVVLGPPAGAGVTASRRRQPAALLGTAAAAAGAAARAAAEPPEKNAAPLAPHCAVCCSISHVCVGTKLGYQLRWYKTSPTLFL